MPTIWRMRKIINEGGRERKNFHEPTKGNTLVETIWRFLVVVEAPNIQPCKASLRIPVRNVALPAPHIFSRIHVLCSSLSPFPSRSSSRRLHSHPLPNYNHDILPFDPPPAATSPASPQFRARAVHGFHAMEGSQRDYRLAFAHRRRAVREYGAGVSARGFVIFMEPGQGDTGWRGRGV